MKSVIERLDNQPSHTVFEMKLGRQTQIQGLIHDTAIDILLRLKAEESQGWDIMLC